MVSQHAGVRAERVMCGVIRRCGSLVAMATITLHSSATFGAARA